MIKPKRKRKPNQGNSFIVVVATISFLAVLVTALLVAVAMCYRLKAYDINSRDNFYYLEQAMDEIYEGIGAIAMEHLNDAYNETAEVLVYYDVDKKSYVTMDDANANKMMKANFVKKITDDSDLHADIATTLSNLITADASGVTVTVEHANVYMQSDSYIIKDLKLSRKASYSTMNASEGSDTGLSTEYVQTITTDLVISPPDFLISFAPVSDDIDELYNYAMISDMGVEIKGIGTVSNITGNIYAAADFYNKEYNVDEDYEKNIAVNDETEDTLKVPLKNKINSYDDSELAKCDGVKENSMYSGLYISGAKVSIIADKLIIPGSIATMNCADLSVIGDTENSIASKADIWADSIILGGYSRKLSATGDDYTGSVVKMNANTYVYDDLEVNATGSKFTLDGTYFGYNYASTDNRTYTKEFIDASTNASSKRKYLSGVKINDGNYIAADGSGALTGQAHYNSSAILVNGASATLDLSNTTSMYIAGQAYVELSKSTTSTTYEAKEDKGELILDTLATDTTNEVDKVVVDTYAYDETTTNGNYTTDNATDTNAVKQVQDYRTGEGLSLKSNQLAYIPPYTVKEDAKGTMYVEWPKILTTTDYFKDIWADLSKVPVIKTVVSGNTYYFYDFSQANADVTMNKYLDMYADLFDTSNGGRSIGDLADLYDITEYDSFKVDNVILDAYYDNNKQQFVYNTETNIAAKLYSNSAISVKKDSKFTVIADSEKVKPLLDAKNILNDRNKPKDDAGNELANVEDTSDDSYKIKYAGEITSGLQNQYKEAKLLLTDTTANATATNCLYNGTVLESYITPINYYFNFNVLNGITPTSNPLNTHNLQALNELSSGYVVYLGEDDVYVTDPNSDGVVKGIVMCKGNVTFANDITEFEGIIVSGGKIIVEHSMDFVANPEVIKSVLSECDESIDTTSGANTSNLSYLCKLFRHYKPNFKTASTDPNYELMTDVDSVQYEDMLAFDNWKKNVD